MEGDHFASSQKSHTKISIHALRMEGDGNPGIGA